MQIEILQKTKEVWFYGLGSKTKNRLQNMSTILYCHSATGCNPIGKLRKVGPLTTDNYTRLLTVILFILKLYLLSYVTNKPNSYNTYNVNIYQTSNNMLNVKTFNIKIN